MLSKKGYSYTDVTLLTGGLNITSSLLPARASEQGNWRASEASETLFSHVYGNSRYYIYSLLHE